MRRYPVFGTVLVLTLCTAGCMCFLPDGEPPEGAITDNRQDTAAVVSAPVMRQMLADRLAAMLLMYNDFSCTVKPVEEGAAAELIRSAVRAAAGIAGVSAFPTGSGREKPWSLAAVPVPEQPGVWMITLCDPDGSVEWQQRFSAGDAPQQ